jgi:membrane protease YdiL (CAAX protease family)
MTPPEAPPLPPPVGPVLALTSPSPRPRWRAVVFLAIVGFYPLLLGLLGHWVQRGRESSGPALPSDIQGLALVCLESFGTFAALFALAWYFGRLRRDQIFWWPMRWWDWLWGGIWSVVVRFGAGAALLAGGILFLAFRMVRDAATGAAGKGGTDAVKGLEQVLQESRPRVEALVDLSALADPLYLLFACTVLSFITAGLREELWRAGFLGAFEELLPAGWRRRFGPRPADSVVSGTLRRMALHLPGILFGAVVFGLGHLIQGPGAVLLTGVVGLILGLVMVAHRSLWTAVLAHGFFDASSFLALGLIYRYRDVLKALNPELGKQLGI